MSLIWENGEDDCALLLLIVAFVLKGFQVFKKYIEFCWKIIYIANIYSLNWENNECMAKILLRSYSVPGAHTGDVLYSVACESETHALTHLPDIELLSKK